MLSLLGKRNRGESHSFNRYFRHSTKRSRDLINKFIAKLKRGFNFRRLYEDAWVGADDGDYGDIKWLKMYSRWNGIGNRREVVKWDVGTRRYKWGPDFR